MNRSDPTLEIAHRTEKGPRATNQDVVLVREMPGAGWLTAVADGMGGLEAGEIASRTAIDVFEQQVFAGRPLASAVEDANAAVLGRADETPMGTTLVAALVRADGIRIVNVGDSRAYRLGPLGLEQVSQDHTVRAEAERSGSTGQLDPASERWSNALTRSLGAGLEVRVDEFGPFELQPGESLLLCSDGVHGPLHDEEIAHWLSGAPDAQTAVDQLVDAALAAGSQDNVSAVVLRWPARRNLEDETEDPDVAAGTVEPAQEVEPEGVVAGKTKEEGTAGASAGPSSPHQIRTEQGWDPGKLALLSRRSLPKKPGSTGRIVRALTLMVLLVILYVLLT